ncbi:hypothetical protein EVAR_30690_1 [Eumeta japonica]|uniref:Uncharacterized protein n=1 Tax=Eumeta variegata TaxID=151549 RepID=A0A4C1VSB7_EUMVA|nr:hypothetical protein EVAR_30690_1 [Eumeta japonica]
MQGRVQPSSRGGSHIRDCRETSRTDVAICVLFTLYKILSCVLSSRAYSVRVFPHSLYRNQSAVATVSYLERPQSSSVEFWGSVAHFCEAIRDDVHGRYYDVIDTVLRLIAAGVAVMVCAATAATRLARRGWPQSASPVAEVYKVLWRVAEPMLFTLSGYHFDASAWSAHELGLAMACAGCALVVRLISAFLIALAGKLTVKESIFVTITWIPKAIVEYMYNIRSKRYDSRRLSKASEAEPLKTVVATLHEA